MSAWTRTIVVPLSIMSIFKPVRRLGPEQGIAELFRGDRPTSQRPEAGFFTWTNFFLGMDRTLKWLDRRLPAAWRKPAAPGGAAVDARALRENRRAGCDLPADGLFDHRASVPGIRAGFAGSGVGARRSCGACRSRRRPGAGATLSLAGVGHGDCHDLPGRCGGARGSSGLGRAVEWLLSKEVRHPGDWQIRRKGVEPTGWHFQFHNAFYPDLDDTAMVLLGLKRSPLASEPEVAAAIQRGVELVALDAESRRRLGRLRRRHR